jgi:hypothetical protein
MSEESEKPSTTRTSTFDAKGVKTRISDKSYERLTQEAENQEISKAELVRHIIYEHQKKEPSRSKSE